MMRVIAGTARGKNLAALPGEDVTRPTINRVKEAMFSSVQFWCPARACWTCLQAAASLALKDHPAGPSAGVFLDASREAIQIVLANCKRRACLRRAGVIPDVPLFGHHAGRVCLNLALLDPPYHHGTVAKALPQLAAHMAPGGVVLCETELDAELPEQVEGLVLAKQVQA